jgi:hypothetical protein
MDAGVIPPRLTGITVYTLDALRFTPEEILARRVSGPMP